ncbi:hypothetical protein WK55_22045 [Burkholderia ubonensis]|nr:hypothetical protein WK55_22045 [Burkholderia ubonensis]
MQTLVAPLDQGGIERAVVFAKKTLQLAVRHEQRHGNASLWSGTQMPRGTASDDTEPQLKAPAHPELADSRDTLIDVGGMLAQSRSLKELETIAQRWTCRGSPIGQALQGNPIELGLVEKWIARGMRGELRLSDGGALNVSRTSERNGEGQQSYYVRVDARGESAERLAAGIVRVLEPAMRNIADDGNRRDQGGHQWQVSLHAGNGSERVEGHQVDAAMIEIKLSTNAPDSQAMADQVWSAVDDAVDVLTERRRNDANLKATVAPRGKAVQIGGLQANSQGVRGEAAVTLWMSELGDAKSDNIQSATTQSANLGIQMDQATQKASDEIAKEFKQIEKDLQGNQEDLDAFKKWVENDMRGDLRLSDGGYLSIDTENNFMGEGKWGCEDSFHVRINAGGELGKRLAGEVMLLLEPSMRKFADDNRGWNRLHVDQDSRTGSYWDWGNDGRRIDTETIDIKLSGDAGSWKTKKGHWIYDEPFDVNKLKNVVWAALDVFSKISVKHIENLIGEETKKIEKMAEIVPSLYSLIDKSTYKAILESEDDALKQLDKIEQGEKSLSSTEKAALEKQEAALKAQLTADFKINAHVDPWKVLEFGNLNELKLVQDVLKRVKEMAEKGDLDGIDKSVIDAAEKALTQQAQMLDAMSHLHGAAEVTMIFGALAGVMEQNNETELNNSEHVSQTQMAARQKDLQKKSDEYEAQMAKAEQMQKTMGCIGKILGWAITAISVVAAAFTGGASLALAGVGLALAAGDEIYQAATGKSFMEEAMKPVMDAIVKPIMSFLSKVATEALEACGVSQDQAELAGSIIAAVCTGAAIAAIVVAGGEVAGKMLSKLAGAVAEQVGKMMESSIGQVLKEGLENLADKVGLEELSGRTAAAMGRMRKALGIDTEEGLQQAQTMMKRGEVVMRVGNDATQGTMEVLTKNAELQADKKRRDIKIDEFDMTVLKQLVEDALKMFADRNKAIMAVMQDMSNASSGEFKTGQMVLMNMARSV